MTTKPAAPMDLAQFAGYTPGPWNVLTGKGRYAFEVIAPGARSKEIVVARVASGIKTRQANCCLIAAAPALLDECRRLRALLAATQGE